MFKFNHNFFIGSLYKYFKFHLDMSRIVEILDMERKINITERFRNDKFTATELIIRWYEIRHNKPSRIYHPRQII